MYKILISILFIISNLAGIGQRYLPDTDKEIDSLRNLMPGAKIERQIDIMNGMAAVYAPVHFDSSIYYSAQAMRIATIQGYPYGIGCSRLYTGNAYYYRLDFKNALVSYLSAQTIFEEGGHYDELGELFLMMGHINFFIVRTSKAVDYYHKAMDDCLASGNDLKIPEVLYALSLTYWRDGPSDSAIVYGNRLLDYGKALNNITLQTAALINLGMSYPDCCEISFKYNEQALGLAKSAHLEIRESIIYYNMAYDFTYLFITNGNPEDLFNGRYFYNLAFEVAKKINYTLLQAMALNGLSEINITEGKYEAARENLDQCEAILQYCEQNPEQQPVPPDNFSFGKIFNFFLVLRTKAEMFKSRFSMAMATGNYKDAVVFKELYFEAIETLKAEQQGKQLELLMAESEAERTDQKIKELAQENELNRLKVNQNRFIFAGIAAVVVIISLFLLIYFQRKRLKAEQKSILNEQRLLRAQMNPHFLFNSLASIQNYIINEDTDKASIYLSRFSQLVRNILENSVEEYVPLEKEIETIRIYLELQKVRYTGKFDFLIDIDTDIDIETVRVPPMLAQPFIENAIEHGIRHKESPGHIDIRFRLEDSLIRFDVEDDGVGREKAREIETKHGARHRSMATSITIDRLATINKKLKKKIGMKIEDLKDEEGIGIGTRVRFGIPVVVK
jgi:tetratricopeptide (TPR) repeat protein